MVSVFILSNAIDCCGPPLNGFGGRARDFQLQGFVGIVGRQRKRPRWRACGLIVSVILHRPDKAGVVTAIPADAEEAAGDEPFVGGVAAAGDEVNVHGQGGVGGDGETVGGGGV